MVVDLDWFDSKAKYVDPGADYSDLAICQAIEEMHHQIPEQNQLRLERMSPTAMRSESVSRSKRLRVGQLITVAANSGEPHRESGFKKFLYPPKSFA
jgi:hypothetical protein